MDPSACGDTWIGRPHEGNPALEVRAHLPFADRKMLDVESGTLVLRVPEDEPDDHRTTADDVTRKLVGIEDLPDIPREVEDILSIKTAECHR
jgi:hypothetical protein